MAIIFLTQSTMKAPAMKDLFQHRYYRLNKVLMKLIGQWPYQSTRSRYVICAVLLFISVSGIVPLVIVSVKHLDDWDFLMDCALVLSVDAYCVIKFVSSTLNSQKMLQMLKLLNRIRTDWEVWAYDREVDILHEYAEKGRKMTIVYAVVLYADLILFATQPVIAKIIDVLLKNGTEPGEFPMPVDYYILDEQKYYFYIALHIFVCGSLSFIIGITYDTMLMVYIQHGCGLFAALGRKLERILNNEKAVKMGKTAYYRLDKPDTDFKQLSSSIKRHNDVVKYADLIEATYSLCFFCVVGLNILMISASGIQITTRKNDPEETIKFIVGIVVCMVNLYIESYMSQILMDHSINIRYNILSSKWYTLPLKTQKLLLLMVMRCNIPCKLTAGKIGIMCMETFATLMKTSLSYFMILRSVSGRDHTTH